MFIQTENTPNPATVKFLPGQAVMTRGNIEFSAAEAAQASPLALRLFAIEGVARVFLGPDFVSITKAADTDWSVLKPMVLLALMEHFGTGQPVMLEVAEEQPEELHDEISAQIRELINTRVRPSVMMDGGDIDFVRFEDGIVHLRMRGACAGCPSSTATLKMGIERMLKHFIPEVQEVRPVRD